MYYVVNRKNRCNAAKKSNCLNNLLGYWDEIINIYTLYVHMFTLTMIAEGIFGQYWDI